MFDRALIWFSLSWNQREVMQLFMQQTIWNELGLQVNTNALFTFSDNANTQKRHKPKQGDSYELLRATCFSVFSYLCIYIQINACILTRLSPKSELFPLLLFCVFMCSVFVCAVCSMHRGNMSLPPHSIPTAQEVSQSVRHHA